MAHILVIDDERAIRSTLKEVLEYESHTVDAAEDGLSGLKAVAETKYDIIICDVKMEGMDGMEFLEKMQNSENSLIPIIMISGHGNIHLAVECLKIGAFDYIEKPLDLNRVLMAVKNASEKKEQVREIKTEAKRQSSGRSSKVEIIGESPRMIELKNMINKVANSEARVLVTGSNGTGKELVARRLHEESHRHGAPFVEVNCAAIPGELIESEMFGHEKGSFTSAIKQRKGKFEQASGGTLFLDEVGDMSLSAQAKVLRALQEGKITRIGGDKDIDVDVRVIAATNKLLKEEIAKGNFREDLYHRLCVIHLYVPKLADRKDDIPLLIDHFLNQMASKDSRSKRTISDDAIKMLQELPWTGNIRELINIIERLVVFSKDEITTADVQKYVIEE